MAGGPGTKLLREDSRVIDIVKRHAAAKKTMAAICAAPTVLKVAVG
jgi:putative intracellular protease/amidase